MAHHESELPAPDTPPPDADWGDPVYPSYPAEAYEPPALPAPPTGHGRLCLAAALVAVAAFGGTSYVLVSTGDRLATRAGVRADASAEASGRSTHADPLPLPPFPTGANLASHNPCSYGTGPQQVAMIYLGLAALGQTDSAQSCVYRNLVPSVTTRSLATDGARYLPIGDRVVDPQDPRADPGGTAYLFRRSDGSGRVGVTVTREPDGRHWITNVRID